jgi:hypothetical protein
MSTPAFLVLALGRHGRSFARGLGACGLAAVGLAASSAALAAGPAAFLEQSQTYAIGAKYQSFRVPTTDVDGKVGYWDVTVELSVDATGKPASAATVAATKSKKFNGNKVIPGNYLDTDGGACNVATSTVDSGRQQGALTCTYTNLDEEISATWFNGPIVGHPFETQLEAAKIDQLSDWEDFAWGLVGSTYASRTAWTCFHVNGILAASQIGPKLTLTYYGNANTPVCAMTLTLQNP